MHTQDKKYKNSHQDHEVTELLSLLKRNRIQPKKRLGQTFLFKQSIAQEIVHLAHIKSHDCVVEIGAGLGELAGKQWRIGLMGHASNPVNVERCLTALAAVLGR